MSGNIDERVVGMSFDNGNFKKGAADTITTLDSLKKALNMDAAKKGLDDLSESGKKFSLGTMADGIQSIADKFKILSIVGITALVNLANKAVDAGLQIAKSLTIDPIKSGFAEYELKLGSIQTILANTSRYGTKLQEVNGVLDELNDYADKTIYNFGDMTKNIGLFTNAGIKIQDASSMIKGFSNAAAASGTSAQGAAGAAYQLSQALSAGTIRLMDWRSLTNVGMGNKNMQNGLIEIADAMGMLNKNTTDAKSIQGNFNASLEKNWLSADVMSNYLKIMAGDLSAAEMKQLGLTKAQIKGFKAQQKIAEEAATKVRTASQLIGTIKEAIGSSWSETFELFVGDFDQATELFTTISDRLGGMVGKAGEARNNLIQGWAELGGRDALISGLFNAFDALLSIIKPISAAFKEIFPPVTVAQLLVMTRKFKEFTEGLILSEETSDKLKRTFKGVFAIFSIVWTVVKGLVGAFFPLGAAVGEGANKFLDITAKVGDWLTKVDEALKKGEGLKNFFSTLSKAIQWPIDKIKELVAWFGTLFGGNIDTSGFTAFFQMVGDRLGPVVDLFKKGATAIKDFFTGKGTVGKGSGENPIVTFINNISKMLMDAVKSIDYNHVFDALSVGLLAGLVLMIRKFIKTNPLTKLVDGIVGGFRGGVDRLVGSVAGVFDTMTQTLKTMQQQVKAKTLLMIAGAVALLAASAVALSLVDSAKLAAAMGALTVMFGQLVVSLKLLESSVAAKGIAKLPILAAALILLAIAVDLLTIAVTRLSKLDWEGLAKGLIGVTVLLGALVVTSQLMSKNSAGMIRGAIGMTIMAVAILLLAKAVGIFAQLSWGEMARGLIGVAAVLTALTIFSKLGAANAGGLKSAAGILILGSALLVLGKAVELFATFDTGSLVQGLSSIGILLTMLAIFTKVSGNAKTMLATSIGMVALAGALMLMSKVVSTFAGMSWEELLRGMAGLAGTLVAIGIAMRLMPKNMLVSAASLVIVGYALGMISKTMESFGGMNWGQIAKSMVMLAGSLAIIAGAMYLMSGALPGAAALIIVAAALSLLVPVLQALGAMEWSEIGKGLVALAGVFLVLGVAALVLTPVVPIILALGIAVGLLGIGLMAIGAAVLLFALGMTALAALGAVGAAGLTLVITAILSLIPLAMQKLGEGIVAFAKVIGESGPVFVDAMTTLIMSILTTIQQVAPEIQKTFLMLIMRLLQTIVTAVPMFVTAAVKLVAGILNGIAKNIGKVIDAGANLIVEFLKGLGRNIPKVLTAAADLIIDFLNGIADTIRKKTSAFQDAGWNIASAIIEGMTGGLTKGVSKVTDAAKNVAKSALDGAKKFLGINSPSKEFLWVGDMSVDGFINPFLTSTKKVMDAAGIMGNSALDGLKDSMSGISDVVDTNMELNPIITPVLDLSNLRKGAGEIDTLVTPSSIEVNGALSKATAASTAYQSNQDLAVTDTSTEPVQNNVIFNQTNNSPKALNEVELYRQSKNLIGAAKGALEKNA